MHMLKTSISIISKATNLSPRRLKISPILEKVLELKNLRPSFKKLSQQLCKSQYLRHLRLEMKKKDYHNYGQKEKTKRVESFTLTTEVNIVNISGNRNCNQLA